MTWFWFRTFDIKRNVRRWLSSIAGKTLVNNLADSYARVWSVSVMGHLEG